MSTIVESLLDRMRDLAREYRVADALGEVDAAFRENSGSEAALRDCRTLVLWHAAAEQGRFEDGLIEAVASIERLHHAGYSTRLGWAFSAAGFSMGVTGNYESGLRFVEQAIAAFRATGERGRLPGGLSNLGALLAMGGDYRGAEQALLDALAIGGDPHDVSHSSRLNNLAFAYITHARSLEEGDPARLDLAEKALLRANEARLYMDSPERARWRAWSLSNAGTALYLLHRYDEAEAAFREGLPLSATNTRVNVVLLASFGRLLAETGRFDEAGALLDEAYAKAPESLLDSSLDLVMESRVRLELLAGNTAQALLWSERRQRRLEDQYRSRLSNALKQAQLLTRIEAEWRFEQERAAVAINESRQRERESLLRDLHDGFGSQLASARLAAQRGVFAQDDLVELLEECIADLYLVVDTLTNTEGHLGAALRFLRNRLQQRLADRALQMRWTIELDDAPALGNARLVQVLRIVQEAIANTLKHAQADNLFVDAHWCEPDGFSVVVRDDGRGLPATLVDGHGLSSMRSRAASLGGRLTLTSDSAGARVELVFPAG